MAQALRIDGVDQLAMRIVDHEGRIDKGSRKVLADAAKRVRAKQKRLVPKRTGLLASAITFRSTGTKWSRAVEIGPLIEKRNRKTGNTSTTKYGLFQEYGTARMGAQPFVAPSLDGEAERLARDLHALLGRGI